MTAQGSASCLPAGLTPALTPQAYAEERLQAPGPIQLQPSRQEVAGGAELCPRERHLVENSCFIVIKKPGQWPTPLMRVTDITLDVLGVTNPAWASGVRRQEDAQTHPPHPGGRAGTPLFLDGEGRERGGGGPVRAQRLSYSALRVGAGCLSFRRRRKGTRKSPEHRV